MKLALALAATAAAITAHDALAKCAMQELAPILLTAPNATLPADGGILVGTDARVPDDHRGPRNEDPALTNTWKLRADGKALEVEKVALAPGLVMYRPKTGTAIEVVDAKGTKLGAFQHAAATASTTSVVAPRATKLETTTAHSGRGFRSTTTATVADPIPTDAFAIIVYAEGKPISHHVIGRWDPK